MPDIQLRDDGWILQAPDESEWCICTCFAFGGAVQANADWGNARARRGINDQNVAGGRLPLPLHLLLPHPDEQREPCDRHARPRASDGAPRADTDGYRALRPRVCA